MTHRFRLLLGAACLAVPLSLSASGFAADPHDKPAPAKPDMHGDAVTSDGTVTIGGVPVGYQAVVGTLVVHPKGWDDSGSSSDAPAQPAVEPGNASDNKSAGGGGHDKDAEAKMSFVAYFKHGVAPGSRPITFLYNGGPGSSTVWLHMGAFGPKRVVTANAAVTPPAPFELVNNNESLLDASDLVFIDAPGTGFGRLEGKDKEKAFWGTDQDAYAFSQFIVSFLTKYNRWNSPKFLMGESYGTMRSAVLSNMLEQNEGVGLNGVILLSQIFDYANSVDTSKSFPGEDMSYVLALPSYAATAWYHHKLPNQPADLPSFLKEVEQFATTDYLTALAQGSALDDARRDEIANKLHAYTGLPVDYIKRADLRIEGDEFAHELLIDQGDITGRLDSRYQGPSMNPLDSGASYDPLDAGIDAAFTAGFNDYVRNTLHYNTNLKYKTEIDVFKDWDNKHQPPGESSPEPALPNVLQDMATAMKFNPTLKVQLNAGYFDLGTPFYEGIYEMQHLPMPRRLESNIEFHQYTSGHMVYLNDAARKQLHDNVANFIRANDHEPAASDKTH
ncbi:peptidase S10 [Acetobacteraceae bacterium KSS8]|uniref:Peptidase S10 n=1 Tax=Endosaccharibacter trunci TaxID=2812733 RepID=A0ABT1W623_9PROT|nr:peptidase S10 [Acetobacteraceae bacterium KSS8]